MSKARNSENTPPGDGPWSYILSMFLSAVAGAGVMFIIMSQRSSPPVQTKTPQPAVAATNLMPDLSGMSIGEAAVVRGNAAYDQQRWPEAIQQYRSAIANGIDNADVRTDLGNCLRFSGQSEQALEQYGIAQKMNPQHENSLLNQISIFREVLHQPDRAAAAAEEFIRRFPSSDKLPAVRQELAQAKSETAALP